MLRISRLLLLVLTCFLVVPAVYAQDAEDSVELKSERAQQREARREARQRHIESLSEEQRQALRERKRIRHMKGAGQRGHRPKHRRPPNRPPVEAEQTQGEEPA